MEPSLKLSSFSSDLMERLRNYGTSLRETLREHDYYMVGGTALSLFYFGHRVSEDLDFFTQDALAIEPVRSTLQSKYGGVWNRDRVFTRGEGKMGERWYFNDGPYKTKFDFMRDVVPLTDDALRRVKGIPVLGIDNLYLRKLLIACSRMETPTGSREISRRKPRDVLDLYCLSSEYQSFSERTKTSLALPKGWDVDLSRPGTLQNFSDYVDSISRNELDKSMSNLNWKQSASADEILEHFDQEIYKIREMITERFEEDEGDD